MKYIPIVDLKSQYKAIKKQIDSAIKNVIKDSAFIGGQSNKYSQEFEKHFASYIGTKHCIGCGNGTDAIEIILKALDIGSGHEVIVPALSWISTSEAVGNCGAKPVFVDVDPNFYTIDPNLIEEKITSKTKAIIPVHLYGLPAEMDKIMNIAKKYNLAVIEDSAQAHGAMYKNKRVGNFGIGATFSFFPGKNLGAYGDAGCIVTNDDALAEKCRMIANHGMKKKHEHKFEGRNSRLDGIQAAVLNAKLPHLDKWNARRIKNAELYKKYLSSKDVVIPKYPNYSKHIFHIYCLQSEKRDLTLEALKNAHVETGIHYPTPLPLLDAYKEQNYKESDFPVASKLTKRIVSLPMCPELKTNDIKFICRIINKLDGGN